MVTCSSTSFRSAHPKARSHGTSTASTAARICRSRVRPNALPFKSSESTSRHCGCWPTTAHFDSELPNLVSPGKGVSPALCASEPLARAPRTCVPGTRLQRKFLLLPTVAAGMAFLPPSFCSLVRLQASTPPKLRLDAAAFRAAEEGSAAERLQVSSPLLPFCLLSLNLLTL
jgi:hypothetical protein